MSDAAMIVAGAIACMGLAGAGSAFGTGFASTAAVGAWKKCYAANKPAPFMLLTFVGAPITQVLYGMIVMNKMLDLVKADVITKVAPGTGCAMLFAGIFAGLAIGLSALFQGRAGAAACDAQAETNQGFAKYLFALGIVETVAIFALVFAYLAIGKIPALAA